MSNTFLICILLGIVTWYYFNKFQESEREYSKLHRNFEQIVIVNQKMKDRIQDLQSYKNDVSKTFKILDNELGLINNHLQKQTNGRRFIESDNLEALPSQQLQIQPFYSSQNISLLTPEIMTSLMNMSEIETQQEQQTDEQQKQLQQQQQLQQQLQQQQLQQQQLQQHQLQQQQLQQQQLQQQQLDDNEAKIQDEVNIIQEEQELMQEQDYGDYRDYIDEDIRRRLEDEGYIDEDEGYIDEDREEDDYDDYVDDYGNREYVIENTSSPTFITTLPSLSIDSVQQGYLSNQNYQKYLINENSN